MANNEYINKVEYGDQTLMDITDTTAESGDVIEGQVFYAKSGARSVGTLGDATTSAHGLMSASDKSKLDSFSSANNYMTQCVIPFGYMDSSSTSTAYVATVPNVTTLTDGLAVYITNNVVDATGVFTLNVNNLGAKEVCWSDLATTRVTLAFKKNQTYLFIYNSSRISNGSWDLYKGFDSDKDTLAYKVLNYNQFTIAKNSIIGPKLIFTTIDGKILAPNTQNTTASTKTITTEIFNPFAPIYYYSFPLPISANNSPMVLGMLNILYSDETGFDLRYSFNISTNLTIKNPVYLKCEPQSDGTAKFINDNSIVQSLPSTEDGYIYIYLGDALSTTNISLSLSHPIYEYKNSGIQLWNNIRNATNNTSGLMSATDKSKLDGIATNANNYTLPSATQTTLGGVKVNPNYGIKIEDDTLKIMQPADNQLMVGVGSYTFITANKQHLSVFYGLAKAAGDTTQYSSINSVGTYTDEAKAAIQSMLGVPSVNDIPDVSGFYTKPSTGIPASDLASGVLPNMSLYATKADPTFTSSISMGRKSGTNVGTNSIALGNNVEASGFFSYAEGGTTKATAAGAHASGGATVASGLYSHTCGYNTVANSGGQYVIGQYNSIDILIPSWVANTHYYVGDKIKQENIFGDEGYICIEENTDSTFDRNKWQTNSQTSNNVFIIGNGLTENTRSNAYAITWDGDGKYAGDVYVNCNGDSTGGVKVATVNQIPDISGKANSADLATVATSGSYTDLLNKPDLSIYLTSVPTMTAADIPMSSSDATFTSTAITDLRDDLGIVENDTTATHTISTGQYVIWNGSLYTADATIASGETLASTGGSKNLTAVSNGGFNLLNGHINGKKYLSGRDYVTVDSNWGSWGNLYSGEFTVDISFNNFFTTVESVIVTPNNTTYAAVVSKVTNTNEKITNIGFLRPTQPTSGNKIYFSWLAIGT